MTLCIAHNTKMLEMRVGLAFGHPAPTSLAKEFFHERFDRIRANLPGNLLETREPTVVVNLDVAATSGEIFEGMSVRRKDLAHIGDRCDLIERIEKRCERILVGGKPRDVGSDRREYVIAGKEGSLGWIVQTDMVLRVTGGVHDEPLPTGKPNHIARGHRI